MADGVKGLLEVDEEENDPNGWGVLEPFPHIFVQLIPHPDSCTLHQGQHMLVCASSNGEASLLWRDPLGHLPFYIRCHHPIHQLCKGWSADDEAVGVSPSGSAALLGKKCPQSLVVSLRDITLPVHDGDEVFHCHPQ